MKQTAVEWLMDNIPTRFKNALLDMCKAEIDKAKEMEKEQIVNAYNDCEWTGDHEDGEQYYKEIFKQYESNTRI
jgi:phage terminase Nu1 subunit (DNA packaging protein)